jgi:hypothetical protein
MALTAHVTKGAGAELQAFAPIAGVAVVLDVGFRPRDTDPLVPIERGGNGVRRTGPGFGIAPFFVAPGVDFLHLAYGAVVDELDGGAVLGVGVNLNPHLGDELLRDGVLLERASLGDVRRQRLLAVHMQAAAHGAHGLRGVHVVRRADADGVQILVLFVEHLAPILIVLGLGVSGLHPSGPRGVDIGGGDEVDGGVRGDAVKRGPGHAVGAHGGETDAAAGRRGDQVSDEEGGGEDAATGDGHFGSYRRT